MASPARLERATCCFGSSRAFLLRHGDMECAGEDSNLRVGYLIYSQARSPLRHRRLGDRRDSNYVAPATFCSPVDVFPGNAEVGGQVHRSLASV